MNATTTSKLNCSHQYSHADRLSRANAELIRCLNEESQSSIGHDDHQTGIIFEDEADAIVTKINDILDIPLHEESGKSIGELCIKSVRSNPASDHELDAEVTILFLILSNSEF